MKIIPNNVTGARRNRNHANVNITFSGVMFVSFDKTYKRWSRIFIDIVDRINLVDIATRVTC